MTLPGTGGTVNFKYDPFGRRIEKVAPTTGTTIYAYDGDNMTEELGAGGNLLAHYTQGAGIDEPLAMTGTGGTYFYHADGLGSITSLTDATGNSPPATCTIPSANSRLQPEQSRIPSSTPAASSIPKPASTTTAPDTLIPQWAGLFLKTQLGTMGGSTSMVTLGTILPTLLTRQAMQLVVPA